MYHPVLMTMPMLLLLPSGDGQSFSDVKNLTDILLGASYDRHIRPVMNQSQALQVHVIFVPFTLVGLDETAQIASVTGSLSLSWTDENLVWDPQHHNGISSLNPYTDQVWTPSIALFNSADNSEPMLDPISAPGPLSLTANGSVTWIREVTLTFTISLNPLKFPYDRQNLTMTFVVTSYGINALTLTTTMGTFYSQESPFASNNEWKLISIVQTVYDSIDSSNEVVNFVTISITIHRRPTFFVLNLLFPTCALSLLNIFVFLLPADSGERITFTMTALLAVMFFMASTTSVLPQAAENIPLVTRYLAILTSINSLTIVATIAVLQVHHREEENDRRKNIMHKVVRRFKDWISGNRRANTLTEARGTKHKQTHDSVTNTHTGNGSTFAIDQINKLQASGSQNWGQTGTDKTDMFEGVQSGDLSTGQTSLKMKPANQKKLLTVFSPAKIAPAAENFLHGCNGPLIIPTDTIEKVLNSEEEQKDNPVQCNLNGCEDSSTSELNIQRSNDDNKEKLFHIWQSCQDRLADVSGERSSSETSSFFTQVSRHLDMIFFVTFLLTWSTVTVYYMAELFTDAS